MSKEIKMGHKRAELSIDTLDDLGRKILELEIANPGISSKRLIVLGNLSCERKTVDQRRRLPAYQQVLLDARRDTLKYLTDLEVLAIKRLEELLDNDNASIRLRAAKILSEAALMYRRHEIQEKLNSESHTVSANSDDDFIFHQDGTLRDPMLKKIFLD